MATSATLGRTGPNFSLPILIITVLYFCGLSSAITSRAVIGRQTSAMPKCVQDCRPKTQTEMDAFCKHSGGWRLESLKSCANSKCGGNPEDAQKYEVLNIELCNLEITAPASVDIGSVTTLVADSTATPSTTTTSIGSTTSPSITPTTVSNSSNDNSSEGNTTANKKGSDLSIPIIVAIAVGGTVFLGMCVGLWYLILCLKKQRREREQKNIGNKGFDNSSVSDLGIHFGSASRKGIQRGAPWTDEENNTNSTAHLYNMGVMSKPRLPPVATKFAPPVPPRPRGRLGGASPSNVSPVSPVSPLSKCAVLGERRSKAISTVSSMKPERTHHEFYNVSSPPLPTPTSAVASRYPSKHKSKPTNLVTRPGATNSLEAEYPLELVSPISRNPSGKSNGARSLSTVEEQLGWEGYRDMIRKYEEQQAQGKPIPPEVIQRLSGLSQFNFEFGESQSQSALEAEKKWESSFYGWAPERSPGGHLNVSLGQNKEKYLSGSSSVYSSQPMTPASPITREAGTSTPEMFFGRQPPSYPSPSPPSAATGRTFVGVSPTFIP
ncbi:hypothetical protein BGX38DRAFT_1269852 [Terfezia claveryi]|nr:hypothetical protein BGX38DRAFT_1269852 [Terfezia claveryi]